MNSISKINLTNLKKCDQIWDDMPEIKDGRLCENCSNTIIDFRNISDKEIAQVHTFSKGKVCGLYDSAQRKLPKQNRELTKTRKWSSLYLGVFGLLSIHNINGQEKHKEVGIEQTEKKYFNNTQNENINLNQIKKSKNDSIYITGLLTNSNNDLVPFASVIVEGTKVGAISNFDGYYTLNVTEILDSYDKLTLIYYFIGYETIKIQLESKDLLNLDNRKINVTFNENEESVFYVNIKNPRLHERIWNGIKNIFRS